MKKFLCVLLVLSFSFLLGAQTVSRPGAGGGQDDYGDEDNRYYAAYIRLIKFKWSLNFGLKRCNARSLKINNFEEAYQTLLRLSLTHLLSFDFQEKNSWKSCDDQESNPVPKPPTSVLECLLGDKKFINSLKGVLNEQEMSGYLQKRLNLSKSDVEERMVFFRQLLKLR